MTNLSPTKEPLIEGHNQIQNKFSWLYFDFESSLDRDIIRVWFQDYWYYPFFVSAMYLAVIFSLKKAMEYRKPLDLQLALVFWNACMAVLSFWGSVRTTVELADMTLEHGLHYTVCGTYSSNKDWGEFPLSGLVFILSKPLELVDTLFIVLRKKPLIFLHWYHHVSVILVTWYGSMSLNPHVRWFGQINFTVHFVMYSYYALCSIGIWIPKIVRMSITAFQILQMVAGCFVIATVLFYEYIGDNCVASPTTVFLSAAMYMSFLVLFVHFFMMNYFSNKKKNKPL